MAGRFWFPARNRVLSTAIVMVRGVWHSPQWATARVRYSPRATPDVAAEEDHPGQQEQGGSGLKRRPAESFGWDHRIRIDRTSGAIGIRQHRRRERCRSRAWARSSGA